MKYDLIHIVPFDIGLNLTAIDSPKNYKPDRFLKDIETYVNANNYVMRRLSDLCLCSILISEEVECLIYSFGTGVFIFRRHQCSTIQQSLSTNPLESHVACSAYYAKKLTQSLIVESPTGLCSEAYNLMKEIYRLKNKAPEAIRPLSSSLQYKGNGLSYEFTIYHMYSLERNQDEMLEIDALLNPAVLAEILDKTKWEEISQKLDIFSPIGFESFAFNANSEVGATWAAVAILEEKKENQELVDTITEYEAMLQCGWFFFDATKDNLEKRALSGVELQKLKNMATEIDHKISCSVSANLSTGMKNIQELIRKTSGYEDIRDSCMLLLENRIDLEQAKHAERQSFYGSLTEILLVIVALFQIYEPIKHLVSDQVTQGDVIVFLILIVVLVFSVILIIRRDR